MAKNWNNYWCNPPLNCQKKKKHTQKKTDFEAVEWQGMMHFLAPLFLPGICDIVVIGTSCSKLLVWFRRK